eukprot:353072-Chlamydomonas_euryale.AAC.12
MCSIGDVPVRAVCHCSSLALVTWPECLISRQSTTSCLLDPQMAASHPCWIGVAEQSHGGIPSMLACPVAGMGWSGLAQGRASGALFVTTPWTAARPPTAA